MMVKGGASLGNDLKTIEWLRDQLDEVLARVDGGRCRMLSRGDNCTCPLCKRDETIKLLRERARARVRLIERLTAEVAKQIEVSGTIYNTDLYPILDAWRELESRGEGK